MISTGRFYALFFMQATHYGATLLVINLVIQISSSFDVRLGPILVVLISMGSTVGRIAMGHIASIAGREVSFPEMAGYLNLGACITNFLFALYIRSTALFCVLVFFSGLQYGAMTVSAGAGVVTMFGVTHVAKNDGMFDLSNAVGSIAVAYGLVVLFRPPNNTNDDAGGCLGAGCYQTIFFVSSFLCLLSALGAIPLCLKIKSNE